MSEISKSSVYSSLQITPCQNLINFFSHDQVVISPQEQLCLKFGICTALHPSNAKINCESAQISVCKYLYQTVLCIFFFALYVNITLSIFLSIP